MTHLVTTAALSDVDEVYQWLIDLHAGRSEDESHLINARLILLLVNHVGDRDVVKEAIEIAAQAGGGAPP